MTLSKERQRIGESKKALSLPEVRAAPYGLSRKARIFSKFGWPKRPAAFSNDRGGFVCQLVLVHGHVLGKGADAPMT